MGFDFSGKYTGVIPKQRIDCVMDDGRRARVDFMPEGTHIKVRVAFDPERMNPHDMQREGGRQFWIILPDMR